MDGGYKATAFVDFIEGVRKESQVSKDLKTIQRELEERTRGIESLVKTVFTIYFLLLLLFFGVLIGTAL